MNIYDLPVPAQIIFDVLEGICRANKNDRDIFVFSHQSENIRTFPTEYRFGGNLGSGGKFYISNRMHDRWYVDCWREDLTPEREKVIQVANEHLERIRAYFIEVNILYKNSHIK